MLPGNWTGLKIRLNTSVIATSRKRMWPAVVVARWRPMSRHQMYSTAAGKSATRCGAPAPVAGHAPRRFDSPPFGLDLRRTGQSADH
jgi:hypothetical protein